jgi:hypothetical protein
LEKLYGIRRKAWRLAQLIVEKYGNEALAVVIERVVGRLIVHDYSLAIMWTRVAEEVHTMLPDANLEHSVWHTRAPLPMETR